MDAEHTSLAGINKGNLKKNNRYGKILLNPNLHTYVQGKKIKDHVKPSNNFIVVIMTVSGECDIMSVSPVYIPNFEMPECDIKYK